MTEENRKILERINEYAENVLGEIDPQKVQVSAQLDKLKPVMQEIAQERNMSLEDVFILYMDLKSEASVNLNNKLKDNLGDLADGNNPVLFR